MTATLDLAMAYKRLFLDDGQLKQDARIVFQDLAGYCFSGRTTVAFDGGKVDPDQTLVYEGRRQALMHIEKLLSADVQAMRERQTDE